MISQALLETFIFQFKYHLEKFSLDKLTSDELNTILSAAKNYGFEIKKNDAFFEYKPTAASNNKFDAALIIKGGYSIPDGGILEMEQKNIRIHLIIFHYSLQNLRLRAICHEIITKKLVKLFPGCDENWLYTSLSEQSEINFYELIQELDKNMILFELNFSQNGSFKIVKT